MLVLGLGTRDEKLDVSIGFSMWMGRQTGRSTYSYNEMCQGL